MQHRAAGARASGKMRHLQVDWGGGAHLRAASVALTSSDAAASAEVVSQLMCSQSNFHGDT